jgi:hypothetical protein
VQSNPSRRATEDRTCCALMVFAFDLARLDDVECERFKLGLLAKLKTEGLHPTD